MRKLHEECGVFGIYSKDMNAANTIYYGLNALQHRGQESAGIVVCDTKGPLGNIYSYKGMGLVSEIFHKDKLSELKGNIGIGHVRYSTTGQSVIENAQPIFLNYLKGTLALAHNGNIINTQQLKDELIDKGTTFSGTTDSEVIAYKIALERLKVDSIEQAIQNVSKQLKGGFALAILSPQKLIGVRDPFGLKPLCLGKKEDGYILSSESAAIDAIGGTFIQDIKPGEMVVISKDGIEFIQWMQPKQCAHCIFEYIYFAKLDSVMDGIPIYDARIRGGMALAKRYYVDADVVTGVPESGITSAVGYAMASKIPFQLAFAKNSYVGRTFIKPTQQERISSVQLKLNVLKSVVKDKRIVLIDDSIVRGTTIQNLIMMLKEAGAKEVHVRISSPPFLYPCFYGTDVPDNSQLIATKMNKEEICKQIGADSLEYMHIDDLKEMTLDLPLCKACFDQKYPIL